MSQIIWVSIQNWLLSLTNEMRQFEHVVLHYVPYISILFNNSLKRPIHRSKCIRTHRCSVQASALSKFRMCHLGVLSCRYIHAEVPISSYNNSQHPLVVFHKTFCCKVKEHGFIPDVYKCCNLLLEMLLEAPCCLPMYHPHAWYCNTPQRAPHPLQKAQIPLDAPAYGESIR